MAGKISWENILTSLEDGVVVVDGKGKISFLNQAAEVLTEGSASQAREQSYSQLFKHNPWVVQMVMQSQPPQQMSTRGEGDLITQWRHRIPINLTVSPLLDQEGRTLGSILLMRDLTRRRELEEDLIRSDRLALVGTLAAGLAHEVKNPLSGIRGTAQLLKREIAREPALLEHTDIIIREVDRLNRLIEQLLDLSRPATLHLEPLNIHELLNDVLLLEQEAIRQASVEVKKNFDPSLPAIHGDRDKLAQVFLNLVKNALQAINGRGALTITTRIETDFHIREQGKGKGKLIRVDIEDNGPGIDEENLPQIFAPFFTTRNSGTGLGLAICHRIIKEHGGLIRVESQQGAGAIFKVSLLVAD